MPAPAPLDLAALLRATVRLFWDQFAPVLAAGFALITLPGIAARLSGPGATGGTAIATATAVLAILFLAIVSFGGVAALAARRPSAGVFLSAGLAAARPGLVVGLVMGACLVVGMILILLARGHPLGWLVRGSVIATLAGLLCAWIVAIPAAVVERLGPFEALKRSAAMTRGRRGRLLAAFVILALGLIPGAMLVNAVVFGPAATPDSARAELAAMTLANPGLWIGALYELLAVGLLACLPPAAYVALARA